MANRDKSKEVKQRFIKAVTAIAKESYPEAKEIDIIRATGMAPTNYYKMKVDDGRYPTLDNCVLLCSNQGISGNWLLTGKGSMRDMNTKTMKPVEMLKLATKEIEMKLKVKK